MLRGAREEIVLSAEQVFNLLNSGQRARHVGATDANEESSRSHTIFRMTIESKVADPAAGIIPETPVKYSVSSQRGRAGTGESTGLSDMKGRTSGPVGLSQGGSVRVSTLSLVDLAGSESARISNAAGQRQKEGSFINKSLLTLAHVIWKLSDPKTAQDKTVHIPYRDSKLTRILQPSLGGNAHVAIICTATPSDKCLEETINTFKFAARAKQVDQSEICFVAAVSFANHLLNSSELFIRHYSIFIHHSSSLFFSLVHTVFGLPVEDFT